jgi:hypothetical protein
VQQSQLVKFSCYCRKKPEHKPQSWEKPHTGQTSLEWCTTIIRIAVVSYIYPIIHNLYSHPINALPTLVLVIELIKSFYQEYCLTKQAGFYNSET